MSGCDLGNLESTLWVLLSLLITGTKTSAWFRVSLKVRGTNANWRMLNPSPQVTACITRRGVANQLLLSFRGRHAYCKCSTFRVTARSSVWIGPREGWHWLVCHFDYHETRICEAEAAQRVDQQKRKGSTYASSLRAIGIRWQTAHTRS